MELHELSDAPFDALCELTFKQMTTGDFDPIYPMLRWLTKDMDTETALWYCTLYAAHYNIASGAWSFWEHQHQVSKLKRSYPIRFQRRNLRAGKWQMDRHIDSLWIKKKLYGSLHQWITRDFNGDPEHDFRAIIETAQEVVGNGRWAGMKLAEVYGCIEGIDVVACDMGNRGSASPRKGLGMFYRDPGGNTDDVIELLDAQGEHLTRRVLHKIVEDRCKKKGVIKVPVFVVTFAGMYEYKFGVAEMETNLCDFKSLAIGKGFYSGKCIDVVLGCLTRSQAPDHVLLPIYKARALLFDKKVLGEFSGWDDVDPSRNHYYSDYGIIPWRYEWPVLPTS